MLIIDINKNIIIRIPFMGYLVWFQKSQQQVRIPLNSGSKVNTINPTMLKN